MQIFKIASEIEKLALKYRSENDKSIESLMKTLSILNIKDSEKMIEKGLVYFKEKYRSVPNKYAGDHEYYNLFKRCLLSGLSLEESYKKTIQFIDREFAIIQSYLMVGRTYEPQYY